MYKPKLMLHHCTVYCLSSPLALIVVMIKQLTTVNDNSLGNSYVECFALVTTEVQNGDNNGVCLTKNLPACSLNIEPAKLHVVK